MVYHRPLTQRVSPRLLVHKFLPADDQPQMLMLPPPRRQPARFLRCPRSIYLTPCSLPNSTVIDYNMNSRRRRGSGGDQVAPGEGNHVSSPAASLPHEALRPNLSECPIPSPGQFMESRALPRFPEVEELPDEALFTSALAASVALVQERLFLGRCLLEIHRRGLWGQWGYSCLNQFLALALQMDPREGREARRVVASAGPTCARWSGWPPRRPRSSGRRPP